MDDRDGHYRKKYLDLLSELERKERDWAALDERLRRILAHLILLAGTPGAADFASDLGAMRDALKGGLDLATLEARLEDLKTRVLRERRWADGAPDFPPIHQILIHLVERLPLPPELSEAVLAVVEGLEPGIPPDGLPDAIEAVTSLVTRVRVRMQEEKRELEGLLLEITSRLKELGDSLDDTCQEVRAGSAAHRDLDEALTAQVRGLAATTEGAKDLESLRSVVRSALASIQDRLDARQHGGGNRSEKLLAEIERLRGTVSTLEAEVSEHRENTRRAREASLRDPLTGCFNRLAYDERMRTEAARWHRYRAPLSLALLDLDRFKAINDTYGHRAGDQVLRTVAQVAMSQVRQVDFLTRHGGEEFAILLPETGLEAALAVAEKVRRAVAGFRFHSRGRRIPISLSCGVASFREGDTADTVFERADRALYRAKAGGRNRCVTEADDAEGGR